MLIPWAAKEYNLPALRAYHGQFTNGKKIHHECTKTRRFSESLLFVSWCLGVYLNQPEKFRSIFSAVS